MLKQEQGGPGPQYKTVTAGLVLAVQTLFWPPLGINSSFLSGMKFSLFDLNFFQKKPNRLIALCYTKRLLHVSFVLEDFFVLFTKKLPLRPVRKMERLYMSETLYMWSCSSKSTLKIHIRLLQRMIWKSCTVIWEFGKLQL